MERSLISGMEKSLQPAPTREKEFPMSDANFERICHVAHQLTGIVLGPAKRDMVYGRLARRMRALNLRTFDQYCAILEAEHSDETSAFINAITTNLTAFFREPHHFDFLADTVFADIKKRQTGSRRVRIWSAGCSTGEEPYSIAIVARENLNASNWDVKVLATDLDSNVLDHGREGIYEEGRIESVSAERQKRCFLRDPAKGRVMVKPELRQMITFNRLNLLEEWPMKGPFDVIFCRNVVIYFNKETQQGIFDRYADLLVPGGYLFIGHSESLHRVTDRFDSLGRTIYQKRY